MAAVLEAPSLPPPPVNYRPVGNLRYGAYTKKNVLPRWVVEQSGYTAEKLVRDGVLEETFDPVAEDFPPPPTEGELDPAPQMAEELNRLRAENAKLRGENKTLAANNDDLRAKVASQQVALGEQTTQAAQFRQSAEAHRVARIEAEKKVLELEERLTEPKPPADPKKK